MKEEGVGSRGLRKITFISWELHVRWGLWDSWRCGSWSWDNWRWDNWCWDNWWGSCLWYNSGHAIAIIIWAVGGDEGAIKVSKSFSYLKGGPTYLSATVRRIDHFILRCWSKGV
jgi:predicted dehydrogenase